MPGAVIESSKRFTITAHLDGQTFKWETSAQRGRVGMNDLSSWRRPGFRRREGKG